MSDQMTDGERLAAQLQTMQDQINSLFPWRAYMKRSRIIEAPVAGCIVMQPSAYLPDSPWIVLMTPGMRDRLLRKFDIPEQELAALIAYHSQL